MYKAGKLEYGYRYTIFAGGKVVSMDALPEELVMEPKSAEVCFSLDTCVCTEYLFLKRVSVVSDRLDTIVSQAFASFHCFC